MIFLPNQAKGKDGKNYVLTEIDKLEIAEKIEVPVVEKVIEKTETIIEKPIEKDVSGEYIVDKINELPTSSDDYKIDAKHHIVTGKQIGRAHV